MWIEAKGKNILPQVAIYLQMKETTASSNRKVGRWPVLPTNDAQDNLKDAGNLSFKIINGQLQLPCLWFG